MLELIRGDNFSAILTLKSGAFPYIPSAGAAFTLTVQSPPLGTVIVQKTLGTGLTLLPPSNIQADFYTGDFYTQVDTQFYYTLIYNEQSGATGVAAQDTIGLIRDITRLTGTSITIYTGNPPYPSGAPYPP